MATTSPKTREKKPWRRPGKRRVRALRERLREMYGVPVNEPNRRPIDELVLTILSQPVGEVEDAIRPGGLAQQKAPRIQAILRELGPEPSLDWTEDAPIEESREYLLSLPGVGRKTAACVLIFSWGLPEIPVDVHIHRVGGRLGLFPANASLERAHDEMLAVVPPEDAYELHVNLIRHGRTLCRPKPRCGECELRRMCPWYRDLDHRELIAGD
jgi:endonuclease III